MTRIFADREAKFVRISSSDGTTGFLTTRRALPDLANSANRCLTCLSSNE
jgi:hypothetical protein